MTNKTLHQTRKGADISLAKRQISPASYRAVLDGKISLHAARELGRDQEPDDISDAADAPGQGQEISGAPQEQPAVVPTGPRLTSRISKNDRLSPCICGCGRLVQKRFAAGHDMVMFRAAREHITEGRELSGEQREYLESSGKMERVRARLAEEDARKREAEARKTIRKGGR